MNTTDYITIEEEIPERMPVTKTSFSDPVSGTSLEPKKSSVFLGYFPSLSIHTIGVNLPVGATKSLSWENLPQRSVCSIRKKDENSPKLSK